MDGSMGMTERVYTAFFPFCGIGAGALGFLRAFCPSAGFNPLLRRSRPPPLAR